MTWRFDVMLMLLVTAACRPGPTTDEILDPDGDGALWPDDCDNADAAVAPGVATDRCDGFDNDCDGLVDEDEAINWYLDYDGDGYGAEEYGVIAVACEGSAGQVSNDLDCDDRDVGVHPASEEVPYNGLDDDCDPATADDDLDGDGFGVADDCDDEDPATFPGAGETCGDGLLNDCDGSASGAWTACSDDAGVSLDELANRIEGSEEWSDQNFGFAVAAGRSSDGEAGLVVVGAVRSNPNYFADNCAGSIYQFRISDAAGGIGVLSPSDAVIALTAAESPICLGTSVAIAGDLVGDGSVYLLAGADVAHSKRGALYIVNSDEGRSGEIGPSNSVEIIGEEESASFGFSSSAIGDADGDGLIDAIVGEPYFNGTLDSGDAAYDSGAAYLLFGGTSLLSVTSQYVNDLEFKQKVYGEDQQRLGTSVAGVGDSNGDGLNDLAVSARYESSVAERPEAAYLILGTSLDAITSELSASDADNIYVGCGPDGCAQAVGPGGDMDGDGYDDTLIAAQRTLGHELTGQTVFLVPGGAVSSEGAVELARVASQFEFGGCPSCASSAVYGYEVGARRYAKSSVTGGGDINGDGYADLALGDPANQDGEDGGELGGAVYLVFGPAPASTGYGTVDIEDEGAVVLRDSEFCAEAGWSVAMADLDDDGLAEVSIGVPSCDVEQDLYEDGSVLGGAKAGYVALVPGVGL